jgi:Flp pilus assembly protein protease CpaA
MKERAYKAPASSVEPCFQKVRGATCVRTASGRVTGSETCLMIEASIFVALAAILVFVIVDDLRSFRIRNNAVLALVLLFLVRTALTGQYDEASAHALFAVATSAVVVVFYVRGVMGGGDVKLLGAAFLWIGIEGSLAFSLLLLAFSLTYAVLARRDALPRKVVAARARIPFGPPIATAWLVAAFPWDVATRLLLR